MKETVGFIGLGAMGKGMARNLLRGGYPLWAYDLRPEPVDDVVASGAQRGAGLRDLADRCDRIVFSLPDTPVVETVLFGPEGLESLLKPGQIVIDCGTTHPLFSRRAAEALARRGVPFLDAPVTGMQARAEAGTLTLMVGGDEEAFQQVLPLLQTIGERIVYMGASGNGQLTKITNNVLFNISCAAMAEILPMAVRLGLDPEKICDVVSTGSGQSFGFDFFSRLALRRDFGPGYPMAKAYKDMAAITELAAGEQAPLPVTAAALHTYQMALARGLGTENKGAMIKVFESILDVEVRSPTPPPQDP